MQIFFTSKQLPELQDMSLQQRFIAIDNAQNKLKAPEKVMLNIIKLLIIVPAFVFCLRVSQDWSAFIWVVAILCLYPLVLRPIQLTVIRKYLEKPPK